jgi:GT2 family glycosyltransferase
VKPLSIVIITYNRPDDLLFLLQNIAGQDEATRLLESVLIIDNASTADYSPVTDFISAQQLPFRYIRSEENLGVARGRNMGIAMADAPILVMIDDDAYFRDQDGLLKIEQLFTSDFARDNHVGLYSFKVFYSSTREMQVNAFPHKKFERHKDKERFLTYYYAGGAHAILKEVHNKAGNYPVDFFYGMEEYDLAYRMLDLGYRIAYGGSVAVMHNESPEGRTPHADKMQMLWVNKSKVAYRYLPSQYFISTALMWSLEYLKKTSYHWPLFWKGWKKIFRILRTEQRKTISKETLQYIKGVEGRIWY